MEELTDKQWDAIESLIPKQTGPWRPRADDRRAVNAILYVMRTGIPWNDLPEGYGDDVTAWRRLKEWEEKGVWKIINAMVAKLLDQHHRMDSLSIDSDTIPAKGGRPHRF